MQHVDVSLGFGIASRNLSLYRPRLRVGEAAEAVGREKEELAAEKEAFQKEKEVCMCGWISWGVMRFGGP
jgi:hypothetical protein